MQLRDWLRVVSTSKGVYELKFFNVVNDEAEDDDEVDLFGSDDEEDEEAERVKAERLAEYNKKKAGKVKPAAKSIVTLDVKPWGKLNVRCKTYRN